MSYNCDICGLSSNNGEQQYKEVVLTRKKQYYTICLKKMYKKKRMIKFKYIFLHEKNHDKVEELKQDKYKVVSEKWSYGTETEKENSVCPSCRTIVENK